MPRKALASFFFSRVSAIWSRVFSLATSSGRSSPSSFLPFAVAAAAVFVLSVVAAAGAFVDALAAGAGAALLFAGAGAALLFAGAAAGAFVEALPLAGAGAGAGATGAAAFAAARAARACAASAAFAAAFASCVERPRRETVSVHSRDA